MIRQKELFTGWSVILNLKLVILESSFNCKLITFDIVIESRYAMTVRLVGDPAGITAALHAVTNNKR